MISGSSSTSLVLAPHIEKLIGFFSTSESLLVTQAYTLRMVAPVKSLTHAGYDSLTT